MPPSLSHFSYPSPEPDAGSVAVIGCDVKRRRGACADCLMAIGEGSGSRIGALRSDPAGRPGAV